MLFIFFLVYEEFIVLFCVVDIVWIIFLWDGLNLVVKEYVVVKNGEEGVLIFLEFVGCVVELFDVVLINFYVFSCMDEFID